VGKSEFILSPKLLIGNFLFISDVRKVQPLLDALEAQSKDIRYFGVDLSKEALERGMEYLVTKYKYIKCFGLWGTLDDALEWLRSLPGQKCILSLGSFFGNDHFDSSVARLRSWSTTMGKDDLMLLGICGRMNADDLWRSYHDPTGHFEHFVRNGLENSNYILGHKWYFEQDWNITGEIQPEPLMHQFSITAKNEVHCEPLGLHFQPGCSIKCFEVFKYSPTLMNKQFKAAGLKQLKIWMSPSGPFCECPSYYCCHLDISILD
jgi:uncharacterized SAM-dependent methyltransferase